MVSIWHLAQRAELQAPLRELHVFDGKDRRHTVAATRTGLWLISEWAAGARIASRVAFSPGELSIVSIAVADDGCSVDVEISSTIGSQVASIQVDRSDGTVSSSVTLQPSEDLVVSGWPRDVITDLDDMTGSVLASQRGLRTGLVHAKVTAPVSAGFMYVQDLTMLGDYCNGTRASVKDSVGGQWPDLGFAVPPGDRPLPAGEPVRISSWHVAFADRAAEDPTAVAEQYLDLLAQLYFHIERPTPGYTDWRHRSAQSRSDLERCEECWVTVDGTRYLRAYVGDESHPPESMVQLAVLLPLTERSRWYGFEDPFVEELTESSLQFFDDRVGSIARWLPEVEDRLDGTEPHEHPRLMDSWYLFHPLLNLARLAKERGDDRARKQFLKSVDSAIRVAHHFGYDWPVFYDVDTLEVIKAEAEPGKGGERDVPGLYAHVLVQAFEIAHEQRYLDEAMMAIRSLRGKGFELTYQTNNVAFGMLAALRLHQRTGEKELLDVAHVLCACLFDNIGLWALRYGHSRDRASFFGMFPMPTAPYTAAYEEAEIAAVCLEYAAAAGDDLRPSLRVLLPEFIRHVTARLDTYYPPNIPGGALTESPKTGSILRDLWIPVEDLGDGWDEAGTVGQEIYGAGIAFSTVARSYVRVPDTPALVYCEYPYRVLDVDSSCASVHVYGDSRLTCRMRVLSDGGPLAEVRVIGSSTGEIDAAARGDEWRDYWVAADQEVTVSLA